MRRAANPWDRFYKDHIAPWRGERDVTTMLPWLTTGRVLELGVGNGKTLHPLLQAGVAVVGLDISFHALRRLPSGGVLADAACLPFADETFSAVLDLHCTGHLPGAKRREALCEARRVTKPGAILLMERLGPDDLRATGAGTSDGTGARVLADGRMTWFLGAPELEAEATAAGWDVENLEVNQWRPTIRGERVLRQTLRLRLRRPE